MIDAMGKALKDTATAILTKASSAEARQTVTVCISGKTEKYMKASGLMGRKTAKESGEVSRMTLI